MKNPRYHVTANIPAKLVAAVFDLFKDEDAALTVLREIRDLLHEQRVLLRQAVDLLETAQSRKLHIQYIPEQALD